jgi:sulfate adenylyltransferase
MTVVNVYLFAQKKKPSRLDLGPNVACLSGRARQWFSDKQEIKEMTRQAVPPHGGKLNPRLITDEKLRQEKIKEASSLRRVPLTSKEVSDVIMLATGSFSPLDGFACQKDYEPILDNMHLGNGVLWPIPITLAAKEETASSIRKGESVALWDPERNEPIGILHVEDKYKYDKKREAVCVFRTEDPAHPGVKKLFEQGDVYLGGRVEALSEGEYPAKYPEFGRPAETREIFAKKGWTTIAAFQTRNPMHQSHEYLTKVALEICDGLFIHPIVGKLKEGDIPADIRMECYDAMLKNYYPADRVVLKVYPMEMRYAGPREAVLHAVIRQNFGCSHLIVGRDHAGVGKYYGPFEAQSIFDGIGPNELHLRPLKIDMTFYCNKCGAQVSSKTCPHPDKDHLMISGTELRKMLAAGQRLPPHYTRPEVEDILIRYYSQTK